MYHHHLRQTRHMGRRCEEHPGDVSVDQMTSNASMSLFYLWMGMTNTIMLIQTMANFSTAELMHKWILWRAYLLKLCSSIIPLSNNGYVIYVITQCYSACYTSVTVWHLASAHQYSPVFTEFGLLRWTIHYKRNSICFRLNVRYASSKKRLVCVLINSTHAGVCTWNHEMHFGYRFQRLSNHQW